MMLNFTLHELLKITQNVDLQQYNLTLLYILLCTSIIEYNTQLHVIRVNVTFHLLFNMKYYLVFALGFYET